ncbi:MAG: methyltransferase [Hyphomicrobium sp.]
MNAASALAARFDAGLPLSAQLAALAALLAFAVYACALFALGRSSTYCSASGLNTRGIYQWTRNPQYTAAILAYTLLALAAPTPAGIAMTALLCATYALMAFAEEPWLSTAYGSAYAAYAARVPRFVNVARGQRLILVLLRQLARTPQRWATLRTKKAAAT